MFLGKLLQPDLVLGGSILSLTPEMLEQHGLYALVLDVDETLVPIRELHASEELCRWVAAIKPHANLWLVSNNISHTRISRIAQSLDVPYIAGALKPSRRKLRQAVAGMGGAPIDRIAMVGDRLFTDVLAGNRLGMFTILVEPIITPAEVVRHPMRVFEVWLSQLLGVSLSPLQRRASDGNRF